MRLYDLAAVYVLTKNRRRPIGRQFSFKAVEQLLGSVGSYSRFLHRPASHTDLYAPRVNSFLAALAEVGQSPWTVNTRRTNLLTLWRFADDLGIVRGGPKHVRTIYRSELSPDGYSLERMQMLLTYFAMLRGTVRYTGLPQSLYWESFGRLKWNIALRAGDMLRAEPAHFDPSGWFWAVERKTGKNTWQRIHEETTAAMAAVIGAAPARKFIWPGYKPKSLYRAFKRLAAEAGVLGTTRFVRSGASSESERLQPGSGWRLLRHTTPTVFNKHYRVAKIADRDFTGPPSLGKLV